VSEFVRKCFFKHASESERERERAVSEFGGREEREMTSVLIVISAPATKFIFFSDFVKSSSSSSFFIHKYLFRVVVVVRKIKSKREREDNENSVRV
jgi:hypothetical protein